MAPLKSAQPGAASNPRDPDKSSSPSHPDPGAAHAPTDRPISPATTSAVTPNASSSVSATATLPAAAAAAQTPNLPHSSSSPPSPVAHSSKTLSSSSSSSPTHKPSSAASVTMPVATAAAAAAASSSSVLPKMSDPSPPPSASHDADQAGKPPSDPASASSAAPPPAKRRSSRDAESDHDASASASADAVSLYTMRSRTRTRGIQRNYAEDKDADAEMFDLYPERRDEDNKKSSSRASAAAANGAAPSISSLLGVEPLRPANNNVPSGNSNSATGSTSNGTDRERERERVRKPLPSSSGGASESTHSTRNPNSSSSSSNAHSSSHSKPASSSQQAHQAAATTPASSSTPQQASSSSNSRKRKAATAPSVSDKTSAHGSSNTASSVKKSSGAAATGAAASHGDVKGYGNTNLLTFERCGARPNKDGKLIADDGTVLSVNDHVYLVCEPPGEPYYLARVMEFLHPKNNSSLPVDALRVNWYYRPRDIGRKAQDTRSVFATMHSDTTPLTALRGKCTIKHKAEIANLDQFRKTADCFWFEKLYDRYIQKNYEVIPTFQIVNVPERVKKVLDERWRFVLVEQGRGKELTAAAKQCKRCSGFCASNNSVDCAVCKKTYHMSCVRPPLLKKPSRGFAWSCAACSRAQERLLEARHTPNLIDGRVPEGSAAASATGAAADDDELLDDDDEDAGDPDTTRTSPDGDDIHPPATAEQQYQASLWPYRYLGMHCKVEDALDYDDRIYPRAATRVGPRHQAVVGPWYGRPVEYVMPPDIKKATRREARQNKEALAAYERECEKRPKWVQETPPGYVERGEDFAEGDKRCTSTLLYKPPAEPAAPEPSTTTTGPEPDQATAPTADAESKMDIDPPEATADGKDTDAKKAPESSSSSDSQAPPMTHEKIDKYMAEAVSLAPKLGIPTRSTNLYDVAMTLLFRHNFDAAKALKELARKKSGDFKEPFLNSAEQKRFEEAIAKFGSELSLVTRHVKTVFYGNIVRYYYTWKKSDRGKVVWGDNAGRKGKKEAKEAKKAEVAAVSKIQDDVADDYDDSAFDTDKAIGMKRQFNCKFCHTKTSRQWRRAPNAAPVPVLAESLAAGTNRGSHRDRSQNPTNQQFVAALCRRCAELWRRYGVQWEDVEALMAKAASTGTRLVKRKLDEELMKEIAAADEMIRLTEAHYNASHQKSGPKGATSEPARKKLKAGDKDTELNTSDSASSNTVSATTSSSRRRDRSDKAAAATAATTSGASSTTAAAEKDRAGTFTAAANNGKASTPAAASPAAQQVPEPRELPCAVCYQMDSAVPKDDRLTCRDCRLTVHRSCYGVTPTGASHKWWCDMCANDRNAKYSIDYRCVLCPVEHTEHELVEPPRSSHKKKSEKDRERERVRYEQAQKAAEYYRRRQEELNKPVDPREALKRTADNNWVHVTCAVWTPEVRFGDAGLLQPSEGIPSIPRARYAEVCRVCNKAQGACVACYQCRALFHVECAHQAGHIFGFDLVPVKGSRRDQATMVTIGGASGQMAAAIWCKEHVPLKSTVHLMHETIEQNGTTMTAMMYYVNHYKQTDLALKGCARKANLLTLAAKMNGAGLEAGSQKGGPTAASAATGSQGGQPSGSNGNRRGASYPAGNADSREVTPETRRPGGKVCITCGTDFTPRWHQIDATQERELTNGYYGKMGMEAQKFMAQRNYQCHKCKKADRHPSPHVHGEPDRQSNGYSDHGHGHSHSHSLGPHDHGYSPVSLGRSVVKTEEELYGEPLQRLAPPHVATQHAHAAPAPLLSATQQAPAPHRHTNGQHTQQHHAPYAARYAEPPPQPEPRRPSLSYVAAPPSSRHPLNTGSGVLGTWSRSPELPRYWPSTMGSPSGPVAPPALPPHQGAAAPPPPPPLSMRPTSSGSPIPRMADPYGSAERSSGGPPPPQPVHPYHGGPSSPTGYGDWRRQSTGGPPPTAPPPAPQRREPLMHNGSNGAIPPLVTHNHLRPPPLGGPHNGSSSGSNGYLGQGMINGRPRSPPGPLADNMSAFGSNHARYGASSSASTPGPHSHSPMNSTSSMHHPFAQILHPQRSAGAASGSGSSSFAAVAANASNVTSEDFTMLGRGRGVSSPAPPRPSEPRNASSASSNPALRNLLS